MDFSHLGSLLSRNPALAIPLVFLGGMLTSLTPCIYPMIPITAAIVGGQSGEAASAKASRWRPLRLSLLYVLGLALVYAALGLFAGLTGTLFGTVSTNPWLYFAGHVIHPIGVVRYAAVGAGKPAIRQAVIAPAARIAVDIWPASKSAALFGFFSS